MTVGQLAALLRADPDETILLVAGPGGAYDVVAVARPIPDSAGALAFGLGRGEHAAVLEVERRERPRRGRP